VNLQHWRGVRDTLGRNAALVFEFARLLTLSSRERGDDKLEENTLGSKSRKRRPLHLNNNE
jgi:hypothetical protein